MAKKLVSAVERIRAELKQRLTSLNKELNGAIKTLEEKKFIPELKAAYKEAEKASLEAYRIHNKAQDIEYEADGELSEVLYRINEATRAIPKIKEEIKKTEEYLSALKEN